MQIHSTLLGIITTKWHKAQQTQTNFLLRKCLMFSVKNVIRVQILIVKARYPNGNNPILKVGLRFSHEQFQDKWSEPWYGMETFVMLSSRAHLPKDIILELLPMPEQLKGGPADLKLMGYIDSKANNLQEKREEEKMKKTVPVLKRIYE